MTLTGAQRDRLEDLVEEILRERHCQLVNAARVVVDARYASGANGWEKLTRAIGQLEDLVGRSE